MSGDVSFWHYSDLSRIEHPSQLCEVDRTWPGDRRPLGIGAGSLALLAFLPDDEVERILREQAAARSAFPFDDIQLRQMIAAARRNGYAYNDVHVFKGMDKMTNMAGVGVPVRSSGGTPVAALHLTAITQRVEPPRCDYIVATLRREADAFEAAYRPVLNAMEPQSAAAGSSQPAAIKAADANCKDIRLVRRAAEAERWPFHIPASPNACCAAISQDGP